MNLSLFDSHAHYDDRAFDPDRDELLSGFPAAGIAGVVDPGCSAESSRKAAGLAEKYPFVYAAAGIHPEDEVDAADGDLDEIARIAGLPKTVAVGEIGLDYHYETPSREIQKVWFERQLSLARDLRMPVIIHDREAHGDTMELLGRHPCAAGEKAGVMHCFSGSAEMAGRLVEMGYYLGFTGVVTFKNSRRAAEALKILPCEHILIETDCPYMAPEPYRGSRCDSRMLEYTLRRIAEIKGVEPETMARITERNAKELFGIP